MTIEPTFKKMLRDQPWDFKTKNEYEEVTLKAAAICSYALPQQI